jgi:hypothetical protein
MWVERTVEFESVFVFFLDFDFGIEFSKMDLNHVVVGGTDLQLLG